MKAVIQKVLNASVSVEGQIISSIGLGLCILVGIYRDDDEKDMDFMVQKMLKLRIYEDVSTGKQLSKSVMAMDLEILCVSQITLYHSVKGNRPDFHTAMHPKYSKVFFQKFVDKMRKYYKANKIKEGEFGAHQIISLHNDGPFTIVFQSPPKRSNSSSSCGLKNR